ncbi:MAG: hypothetical protein ACRC9T_06755, partial [Vibrionaceae bacterium]
MASSTPPSSGRNTPVSAVDASQVDQTQDSSSNATSSMPIVNVSASSDAPVTATTSTTASVGDTASQSSGPVVLTLRGFPTEPTDVEQQAIAPITVAQMTDAQVSNTLLSPVMLDNSGFSADTTRFTSENSTALASFALTLELDSTLFVRSDGDGSVPIVHASGHSTRSMQQAIDRARSVPSTNDFIRLFDGGHFALLTIDGARQILQRHEDQLSSAALPIEPDRSSRRDSDPDAGASTSLPISEPSALDTEGLYATIQKTRTAPQEAASRTPSITSTAQAMPLSEPTYVEIGELSTAPDSTASEGATATPATVSLDDFNIPPFSGETPTPEQIDAQIAALSMTMATLAQEISALDADSEQTGTEQPSGTVRTASGRTPASSLSPVFMSSASGIDGARSGEASSSTDAQASQATDESVVPFTQASSTVPFVAPSQRRAS